MIQSKYAKMLSVVSSVVSTTPVFTVVKTTYYLSLSKKKKILENERMSRNNFFGGLMCPIFVELMCSGCL